MKLPVKKSIKIPDGKHFGVIVNIRYRSRPYDYVDLIIESKIEEEMIELKVGYPALISENSKLGQLLMRFGEQLTEGIGIDPDEVLISKKCQFKTFTETNERGSFARIDTESVKPCQESIVQIAKEN